MKPTTNIVRVAIVCAAAVLLTIGVYRLERRAVSGFHRLVVPTLLRLSVFLVALTGFGQTEDRRRSLAAGFDEHLVKPLSFERLQQALHHATLATTGCAAQV